MNKSKPKKSVSVYNQSKTNGAYKSKKNTNKNFSVAKNNIPKSNKNYKSYSNRTSAKSKNIDQFERNKKQLWAILLFSIGLLIFFVTAIEGANLWKFFHDNIFGLFGITSFVISPIFIYISILTTMEKSKGSINNKFFQIAILLILISSTIQIFGSGFDQSYNFLKQVQILYTQGIEMQGGGVTSFVVAWPLIYGFGTLGAKIIIVILIFIFVMLLTGSTLLGFLKMLLKPVKKIEEKYTQVIEEKNLRKMSKFDVDVELSDQLPSHPVCSSRSLLKDINPFVDKDKEINFDKKIGEESELTSEVKNYINFENNSFNKTNDKAESKEIDSNDSNVIIDDLVKKLNQGISPDKKYSKLPDKSVEKAILKNVDDSLKESDIPLYKYPSLSFLKQPRNSNNIDVSQELRSNAQLLVDTLNSFGVKTKVIDISRGPSVTRYELQPSAGVKISKITNLADDIALNLATAGVRIEAPIPNKPAVGIEVPNTNVDIVTLREIIESNEFDSSKSKLTVCLGKDIAGNTALADLSKMPHTLIAGSTGSGKSVCINSIIVSLLYKSSPDDVKLLMIDPKVVELGIYNGIPHLLVPVVTDPRKAAGALNWAVTEMLKRYKLFADNGVRDLNGYNKVAEKSLDLDHMPQIVIIIDELADLMMAAPNEVEDAICRLAQMARAAGMHLVIATQRPSVDVITGVIKANIPSRISFAVSSQVDSRTILDGAGAEKLLGRGDMLFSPVGSSKPFRVQGCFVSDREVEQIVSFIKNKGFANYDEEIIEEIEKQAVVEKGKNSISNSEFEDEMLAPAIKCVVESGQASTSYLQRKLKLGYARAARIIDELEEKGIVGPYEGGKREVMMSKQQLYEMSINDIE